ncbi:ATP-grasp domain-containing protein [Lihuaxuella thermophila]|uniref:ATP-grasp domain-containing protein n=1 Tax=Lihuaxuella thermophila TaxID=1173111 RepID=A0A1H8DJJ6_9BACL|nr:ATP-grasp domain-containing protein [Lihuaxuella thermophila]SEN07430.1 ATP-grasp domain-containing protein [Lihuaxuella thermophila]
MSILIFNKLPHSDVPYEKWLEDLNEELLLLTARKWAKDFNGYAQIMSFDDYDTNNAIEWIALEWYKQYPYHTVIATAERDILRAARIRQLLGIDGQSWESALSFRNKVKMKQILSEAKIEVPPFKLLETPVDLYEFIEENGYPVVVKPVDGMGSRNTTVLHDREETIRYLTEGLTPNLEVEKFIEGQMYHIDGLVLDGELIHIWPSKYINDCLAFHEGKCLGSHLLEPKNPLTPRLKAYVASLLNALPTPLHTTFHAEVFHTPQDELIVCEVACRTGGSRIVEEFRQAFEIDLTKLSVQAQCGLKVEIPERVMNGADPKSQFGFIGIPPKQGIFHSGPAWDHLPPWVTEYKLLAESGQYFTGAHTSVDYVVTLVVKGDSERQVYQRLLEMADFFEQTMVWG